MTTKTKRFFFIGLPLILILGLAGLWYATTGSPHDHVAAGESANKQLYTCGMHPNVIQDKPGNCPICAMKLTPLKRSRGAASTTASGERKIKHWRAPMDPTYISDQPGKSPMGMDLIPVYEDEAAATESASISIDPVTIQNMGIRTDLVSKGPLRRVLRTVGTIDYNETALADVTTKFKGWVEKLYVDATGQQVHKGDPLFEIYSPDLYSAQTEYLLARGDAKDVVDPSRQALMEGARLKLNFYDISQQQIDELVRTGQPKKTLQVGAPIDGFVTEKMVVEGMMAEAGMKLYRLVDLGIVWVYAEVYEQDLPFIELGQEALVSLSYLPDRQFRGRVTYVYPTLDEKTRTARVRMEFHNPGYLLKPGMFASVEIHAELEPSTLLVPDMAVLRSGKMNTVFVALPGGAFEPRTVVLGSRAENDKYQVLNGLTEGERVVTSGQFMLDSESQLREAIQKMLNPGRQAQTAAMTEHDGHSSKPPSASAGAAAGKLPPHAHQYVCPMPEHVSIQYQHPGKCPICSMTLVPVSEASLAKMQPGGKLEFYTCPMPEHADVHEDNSGKCPKCGMTLIPVMTKPEPPEMPNTAHDHTAIPSQLYTCPMGIHADIVSDKPGKCAKCEMKLVETSTVKHAGEAEENWLKQNPSHPSGPSPQAVDPSTLYTCPMEEHADVVSDQPGVCPKCEVELVETTKVKHGNLAEANWAKQHRVSSPTNAVPQNQH